MPRRPASVQPTPATDPFPPPRQPSPDDDLSDLAAAEGLITEPATPAVPAPRPPPIQMASSDPRRTPAPPKAPANGQIYPLFVKMVNGELLTFEFPTAAERYKAAATMGRRIAQRQVPAVVRVGGKTYIIAQIAYLYWEPTSDEREIAL